MDAPLRGAQGPWPALFVAEIRVPCGQTGAYWATRLQVKNITGSADRRKKARTGQLMMNNFQPRQLGFAFRPTRYWRAATYREQAACTTNRRLPIKEDMAPTELPMKTKLFRRL